MVLKLLLALLVLAVTTTGADDPSSEPSSVAKSATYADTRPKLFGLPTTLLAGAMAGIASRTATAPMDRMKVVLQTDRTPLTSHPTVVQTFQRLYREGGFRGLYRGNFANVIKVAPENAIKMFTFDYLGGFSPKESRSIAEQFLIGATAGAVSQAATYPLETIKTRFAVSTTGQFKSLASCATSVYRAGGLPAFYRGLTAASSGMIPYSGVDLTILAFLHQTWRQHHPDQHPSPAHVLLFGAISSSCGQVVTYPLNLIRTRLQSQGMPQNPVQYDGLVDCFRRTVRSDGFRGLYRGIKPNFLKALPSMSISYTVFDLANRHLKEMAAAEAAAAAPITTCSTADHPHTMRAAMAISSRSFSSAAYSTWPRPRCTCQFSSLDME